MNTTDRAQRAALNLANLATCAMVTRSPEHCEMSRSDLERLVVDAEASAQLLGYRVTHNDLRQARSQHLQEAEAQELSQLYMLQRSSSSPPASGQIRSQQQPIGCGTGREKSSSCRAACTG